MGFQGNLGTMHLSDLLQNLMMNHQTGILMIKDAESGDILLFFYEGNLSLFNSQQLRQLDWQNVLISKGKITQDGIHQGELQNDKGEVFVKKAINKGLVTEDEFAEILKSFTEEEIFELFRIESADFEFKEAENSGEDFIYKELFGKIQFNINHMMMEAARRIDEWERIGEKTISRNAVFMLDEDADLGAEGYTAEEQQVLGLADGRTTFGEIVLKSGLGKMQVGKLFSSAAEKNMLRSFDKDELENLVRTFISEENYEAAVSIFQALLELENDNIDYREGLAKCYEKLNMNDNSVLQYEIIIGMCIERELYKEAIGFCRTVLELMPSRHNIHRRLADVYLKIGKGKEAVTELKLLVEEYLNSGMVGKAQEACVEILEISPGETKVQEELAKSYLGMGEKEKAVETYKALAENLQKRENYKDAIDIYRRVLKIDSSDRDAKEKIAEIMTVTGMARARKRKIITAFIVLLVIGLVAGGIIYYYNNAKNDFNSARNKAEELVENKEYYKAKDVLQGYVDTYHFSPFTSDASDTIDKIERLILDEREKKTKTTEEKKKKLENAVTKLLRRPDESPLEPGIAAYEKLISERKEDLEKYELLERLTERLNLLKNKLAEAQTLYAEAKKMDNAGKYGESVKLYAQLLADFGNTQFVNKVTYPVAFSASVNGAYVVFGKEAPAKLPCVKRYKPGQSIAFSVSKPGYIPVKGTVKNGAPFQVSAKLNREYHVIYNANDPIESRPFYKDGVLFFGSRNGKMAAVEARTGKELWQKQVKTAGSDISATPEYDDGNIYIGTFGGHLYAIIASSGDEKWKVNIGRAIKGGAVVHQVPVLNYRKLIFVGNEARKICALYAKDGRERWVCKTNGAVYSTPVALRHNIFIGCSDNNLYVLEAATGKIWATVKTDGQIESKPLITQTSKNATYVTGYITSKDRFVYCFRLDVKNKDKEPEILWKFLTKGPLVADPVLVNDMILCGGRDGILYALDRKTGKVIWKKETPGKYVTTPFVYKNRIYISVGNGTASGRGYVLAYRLNGDEIWRFSADTNISSAACVYNDKVYVGSDKGIIFSFDVLK